MLHAYGMTKDCKNLYYTVTPLTKDILDVIITNLHIMGIVDVAYNLHFHQLNIRIPKTMSTHIIDSILKASTSSKIESIVPSEVTTQQYRIKPR